MRSFGNLRAEAVEHPRVEDLEEALHGLVRVLRDLRLVELDRLEQVPLRVAQRGSHQLGQLARDGCAARRGRRPARREWRSAGRRAHAAGPRRRTRRWASRCLPCADPCCPRRATARRVAPGRGARCRLVLERRDLQREVRRGRCRARKGRRPSRRSARAASASRARRTARGARSARCRPPSGPRGRAPRRRGRRSPAPGAGRARSASSRRASADTATGARGSRSGATRIS